MKYYENLDDYNDGSRPPIFDWVVWFMHRVFVVGAVWLVFAICGTLESL
jgi:hypothetical protein